MSNQDIDSWIVPLVGHQFELEDLPIFLSGRDVHVAVHEDKYALVIPSSVIGGDYEPVREFAEEQLHLINGACRLLRHDFRPVSLVGHFFGIDSNGKVVNTVVGVDPAEIRIKAGSGQAIVDGHVQSDSRRGSATLLLHAANISSRARDALTIVGRPKLTWPELYLLFELVEGDVGSRMFELGWVSSSEVDRFTHTANSYSALGIESRHGKDKGVPPVEPMSLKQASSLIRGLVQSWLHEMAS